MNILTFLAVFGLATAAASSSPGRILGGQLATIENNPFAVAAINTRDGYYFNLECGGVILSSRSVLTAAHCFYFTSPQSWRLRVGSANHLIGGNLYTVAQLIHHPQFRSNYNENDIGIMRIQSTFVFSNQVQPGSFAGATYQVADNQSVRTIGWGSIDRNNSRSDYLRSVNIFTVNQDFCRRNYNVISMTVLPDMMCAGNIAQNNVGPCYGDYGGPLLHNNVVIGISSWDAGCGSSNYPTVYTRVPRYIDWIRDNA